MLIYHLVFLFRFYIILHGAVSIYLDSKQDDKDKTTEAEARLPSAHQPAPPSSDRTTQDGVQDGGQTPSQSIMRARSVHSRGSRRKMARIKKQQVVDRERERKKLGMMVATLGIDLNFIHVIMKCFALSCS